MISLLNKKYEHLGETKFFRLAPVICFISDILVLYYVISTQLPKLLSPNTIKLMISIQNANVARNMNMSDFRDASLLMQNQMAFALSMFLILHFFIYTGAFFKKKWPLKYISNYTFFGTLLTVGEVLLVLFTSGSISKFTFMSFTRLWFCLFWISIL